MYYGIADYEPRYCTTVDEVTRTIGDNLRQIIGRPFSAAYLIWDQDDEWHPDGPVVLRFKDLQLEICAWGLDKLSLTFNEIDLGHSPSWYDSSVTLKWRLDPFEEFVGLVDGRVEAISVLEFHSQARVVSSNNPSEIGKVESAWLLPGIELQFTSGWLSVYNALDENGISFQETLIPEIRKTLIAGA